MDKGKKFYELRLQGLTNVQIAQQNGLMPHSVGARVCEYRKKHDLPPLPKAKPYFINRIEDEDLRLKNMTEVYRREDGVLQCPTRTCNGFGFDKNLDLER